MKPPRTAPDDAAADAFKRRLSELARSFEGSSWRVYFFNPDADQAMPLTPTTIPLMSRRIVARQPAKSPLIWAKVEQLCAAAGGRFDTALDVGVNYGYTTAWLARMSNRVIAVEPNPANLGYLREHLALRNLTNVEAVAAAAAATGGTATLHVKPQDGHHSLGDIGASRTIGQVTVPLVTIDGIAAERGIERIDFLKIDVEGFEGEVIEGAATLLARHAIGRILFEFSPAFYRQRDIAPTTPTDLLQRHGYRICNLDGMPVDAGAIAANGKQTDLLALAPGIEGPNK